LNRHDLTHVSGTPLRIAALLWATLVTVALYLDHRAEFERLRRKTIRGTRLISPRRFARAIRGEGLGVPYLSNPGRLGRLLGQKPRRSYLRIRPRDEMAHVLLCGDTGMGKSVLIHNWLSQIRERKPPERALIYDPALEFWECHGRPGDILLHPLSGACPFWDLADELRTSLDARAMTKSFLPDRKHGQPGFWDLAPQRLLGFLLLRLSAEGKTIQDLLGWLSDPGTIDTMVSGTTLAPLIAPEAPAQRGGFLASLNLTAEALDPLPPERGRERFFFRSGAASPDEARWVFIASPPRERTALRPLVS